MCSLSKRKLGFIPKINILPGYPLWAMGNHLSSSTFCPIPIWHTKSGLRRPIATLNVSRYIIREPSLSKVNNQSLKSLAGLLLYSDHSKILV